MIRLISTLGIDVKAGSSVTKEITIGPAEAQGPVSIQASGFPEGVVLSVPSDFALTRGANPCYVV